MNHRNAQALVVAIRAGDVPVIELLLREDPALASLPLGGDQGTRTPLHVVTDWPGFAPNAADVVRLLIAHGADPNARSPGPHFAETPLHWAASSDDHEVAGALIDGGADVDAPDGSIGTPVANAVGYGCWNVARLLVARGARVDTLWQAAALGMLPRMHELLDANPSVSETDLAQAFWHACNGGQRRAAVLLRERGALLDWIPSYAKGTPLDAAHERGTQRDALITWLRDSGARSAHEPASS